MIGDDPLCPNGGQDADLVSGVDGLLFIDALLTPHIETKGSRKCTKEREERAIIAARS